MRFRWLAGVLGMLLAGMPARAQVGSPAGPVPAQLLEQRRALLLDRIGDGVVVLRSARAQDEEGEDYPQASDFRQDNDFFYLSGLEAADAWLVLAARTHGPDQVVLFIAPRNPQQEQWTGPGLDARTAALVSGISDVRSTAQVARA
ncbi:MAG TPA: aminopeptidase P N-terminal domain-containing protein, partial [Longimicrobiales bacterium]